MSILNIVESRRFVLMRFEDETGVSGTGAVAEGIEFSDGSVAMRWRSHVKSTTFFESLRALEAIHGHDGKSRVLFLDGPDAPGLPTDECLD